MASLSDILDQIGEMNAYISELQHVRAEKERKIKYLSADVRDKVQQPLNDLYGVVEGATKGSHVGASQCESAISGAAKKAQKVQSILKGGYTGGLCIGSSGGGGNMIHVTSDIGAKASSVKGYSRTVQSSGKTISQAGSTLGTVNESMDTETVDGKISDMSKRVNDISGYMDEFGQILSFAGERYKDCQEKAIARANRIPK